MIDKIAGFSHSIAKGLVFVLLSLILAIVIVQIVLRFVFVSSLPWSEEIVRCLLIWLTFIGASVALRDGTLVGLDLLHRGLKSHLAQRALRMLIALLSLSFVLATAYYGYKLVSAPGILRQSFATLPISQAWIYAPVPISAVFMAIQLFAQIFYEISGKKLV